MKFVEEIEVKGKTVFLRVDFNVPLDENLNIRDDTRIQASLPTIKYLLQKGARLVVASHLGRPKGQFNPKMSLKPVAGRLGQLLPGTNSIMAPDVIGPEVNSLKAGLKEGELLLLENVRFYKQETDNDPEFSRKLAEGCQVFVNDAFGSCHRAHASVVGIASFIPEKAAGYLLKKEVDYLKKITDNPQKPFVAILGGAKIEDKIPVLESLVTKADALLIGGAMAYTFLKARGLAVGKSLVEEDKLEIAAQIMKKAEDNRVKLLLPLDHVLAVSIDSREAAAVADSYPLPEDLMGVDIGPRTIAEYGKLIKSARTIFWNGPLGVFEVEAFARGTMEIAAAVAGSGALSVVGGGDSIAAIQKAGLAGKISHISTGGGASLEFVAYGTLPGIEALE
ncbi:MAG: phosphoglycerate kinase [Candidatus Saccharicenans sp.]|jgi:phosphoglycerate kinase|nr:phosphoglycerate kinase [Candidatus Saccharicenans sp.]MDH7575913.1 phosphoglycerate kinase [Candidatus Saccharicenans sp.]